MSDGAGDDYISRAITRLSTYLAALMAGLVVLVKDYGANFAGMTLSESTGPQRLAGIGYSFLIFLVGFSTVLVAFALVLAFNAESASNRPDDAGARKERRRWEKKIKSLFSVGANLIFVLMMGELAVFLLALPLVLEIQSFWIWFFLEFSFCVLLLIIEVMNDGMVQKWLNRISRKTRMAIGFGVASLAALGAVLYWFVS